MTAKMIEVTLTNDVEEKLDFFVKITGKSKNDLLNEAMVSYINEMAERYSPKSGSPDKEVDEFLSAAAEDIEGWE